MDSYAHQRKNGREIEWLSDENVIVMRFEEGERVTGPVEALWSYYQHGRPGVRYLTGIRVHTSKGRILEVKPKGLGCSRLSGEKHEVPEGRALRSIQILEFPHFDTFELGPYNLTTIDT